jgi:hypothetical protein
MGTATKREEQDASAGSTPRADDPGQRSAFVLMPQASSMAESGAGNPQSPAEEDSYAGAGWYAFIM